MTLHNILTVFLALTWLGAQTVAVAGHCQGAGGSLERALAVHAHDHDHDGTGAHDHHETDHHGHAIAGGSPHAPDTTQPSDECSVGYVALALLDVAAGEELSRATLTGRSDGRPLNPHRTNLPTPPPNTVL